MKTRFKKGIAVLLTVTALLCAACGGGGSGSAIDNDPPAGDTFVAVTGVALNKSSVSIKVDATESLSAMITPSNATNRTVTWTSSNPGVAAVSQSGLITAVGEGTATITVTTQSGGKKAVCSVTVSPNIIPVTGVFIKGSTGLTVGTGETLFASIEPPNATNRALTWISSNPGVATVSQNGDVAAVAEGTATITATSADSGRTASCVVTVSIDTVPVEAISLNKSSATIQLGQSETLIPVITPSHATNQNVTWSSDNPGVASVAETGAVTGFAVGTATITATAVDNGRAAYCTVTVTPITPTGVYLDRQSMTLVEGATETLVAGVAPPNATNQSVTWSSSNPGVASVSQSGAVSAVRAGSATITVTTNDGGRTASCAVTVTSPAPTVTRVTISPASATVTQGKTQQFTAQVEGTNNPAQTVTWMVTGGGSGTSINGSGVLTVAANESAKTLTVRAISTVDTTKTGIASVTVSLAAPTVTRVTVSPISATVTQGRSQQFAAKVEGTNNPAQTVTWTVTGGSSGTSISSGGLLTVAASESAKTLTVTARSTVDTTKSGTASVSVSAAAPTVTRVTVSPTSATVTQGRSQQFAAQVEGTNNPAQTVTWTVTGGSSGTSISSGGLLTVAARESAKTLTVTARSTVDTTKSAVAAVTVSAATPTVAIVMIIPESATVAQGETQKFSAQVGGINNPVQTVTWTVSGGGSGTSISSSGLLTVSASESAKILTVKATSTIDTNISDSVTVTVIPALIATPTNLRATATSITSIQIDWDSVAGAVGYHLYLYSGNSGVSHIKVTLSTPSYTHTGLSPNTNYAYQVSAYNSGRESELSQRFQAKTPAEYEYVEVTGGGIEITGYNGTVKDLRIPLWIDGEEVVSIGHEAFYECGLTSVIIPASVTSIGNYAFYHNPLKTVNIPPNVTYIGRAAFYSNRLGWITIGKGVHLDPHSPPCITPGFYEAYYDNAQRAGTYVCYGDSRDDVWTYEP